MSAPAVAPAEAATAHDAASEIRHAFCTWCQPRAKVVAEGAVAACGYRRPPGELAPPTNPTCVVCDDLVDGGRVTCPRPDCPTRFRP